MRCGIYTRVSTSEQAEEDKHSLPTQLKLCKKFMTEKNGTLYDLYSDEGYSGGNLERPEIKKLLNDIRGGKLDAVIVYRLDRLTRSQEDFHGIINKLLKSNNVRLFSVTEDFNSESNDGKLHMGIKMLLGEDERLRISQRVVDAMEEKAANGEWSGGHAPLGYDVDTKNHRLILNVKEAEIVKLIFSKFIETKSKKKVATYLNDKEIGTKLRCHEIFPKEHQKVGGKRFTANAITKILKNKKYIGIIEYREKTSKGLHEAIIQEADFELVSKLLEKKKRNLKLRLDRNKRHFLLKGLIHCQHCGSHMTSDFSGKKDKNGNAYLYYTCTAIKHGKTNKKSDENPDETNKICSLRSIPAREFEKVIKLSLKELANNDIALGAMINKIEQESNKAIQPLLDRHKVMAGKVAEMDSAIQRLISLLVEDSMSSFTKDININLKEIRLKRELSHKELLEISSELKGKREFKFDREKVKKMKELLKNFTKVIDNLSLDEQEMLLSGLIERIDLSLDGKGGKKVIKGQDDFVIPMRTKSLRVGLKMKELLGITLNFKVVPKSSYHI